MPDIPDPLLLPLGALLTTALAAIIGGGYMLLCENRPLLARRMESLMPALGTLVCAAAIVATIGGGDGWMLAGLTAPLLYAVQSYLWIGVLRQEAALAEEAAFRRKALGDLAEPLEGEAAQKAPGFRFARAAGALGAVQTAVERAVEESRTQGPAQGPGEPKPDETGPGGSCGPVAQAGSGRGEEPAGAPLTFTEAAKRLGLSPATARSWADRGLLERSGRGVSEASVEKLRPRIEALEQAGVPRSHWARRLRDEAQA